MTVLKLAFLYLGLVISLNVSSQNLLNVSTWTESSGNVPGFTINGSVAENVREMGVDHVGDPSILWKCIPDASSGPDGGWVSSAISIDNSKSYRLTVWIKKSNSRDGNSYFGCQTLGYGNSALNVLNLNGTLNSNPYFFAGDLPELDRWYLLVGYVFHKNYTEQLSVKGGLYDGVTGKMVGGLTDFKFSATANKLHHRAYLYYDTNTLDRQYFYGPRIEQINGNELTLDDLLKLKPDPKLIFSFDSSGNQSQRLYCPDGCSVSSQTARKQEQEEDLVTVKEYTLETITAHPNPTADISSVEISPDLIGKVESIRLFNLNSALLEIIQVPKNGNLKVNLIGKSQGVYFLHIHLNDGSSITKKIVKN